MEEKELKTSTKQRVVIIIIAVLMLGSIIASYAAIILNGSKSSNTSSEQPKVDEAKVAEYKSKYDEVTKKFQDATKSDFDKFVKYKSEIKAYNEASANGGGVDKRDLKEGSGDKVTDDNYLAYYVGWCADETIFDSSFDDPENPTSFASAIDPSRGLVEGWGVGVEGMKIGGIREITISSELAYGDSMEICGGYNKPIRFIIMAVAKKDPLKSLTAELEEANMRYQYAMYGMDYDEVVNGAATESK